MKQNKEDFLTIMRYSLPQRKIALNPILPNEKEIASKLFGKNKIKDLEHSIAPMSMPIYCEKKETGFIGDNLGMSEKFCDEFFSTPSDNGICLTKDLNINEIMYPNDQYEQLLETNLRNKAI